MTDDEVCDVLCVGSGAGGLAAAIAAGHAGAEVIVVEKAAKLGGATAYSGGQIWAGATHVARAAGIVDSAADTTAYLDFLGEGLADANLRDVFVSRSPEALEFLTGQGVPLTVVRGLPDYYFPLAPGSKPEGRIHEIEPWPAGRLGSWADRVALSPYGSGWVTSRERVDAGGQAPSAEIAARRAKHLERGERCAGAGLAAALVHAAFANHVTFRTDTRAVELIADTNGVTGLVVEDGQGRRRIRARGGVVLATGGYDWHPDFMRRWDQVTQSESMAPRTIEGDHLTMAVAVDAAIVAARRPDTSGVLFGMHTSGDLVDGHPAFRYFVPGLPHSVVVNAAGRRFADDAFHPSLVAGIAEQRGGTQPNWPAWLIVDQAYVDKYGLGALPPGSDIPPAMATQGASPEKLAAAAGIDLKGLPAEIAAFNCSCAAGADNDFQRGTRPYTRILNGDARMPNPNLGALHVPPFYAVPLTRIALNGPSAGLLVDADSQVLSIAGAAVPGLYAAGNAAAQVDIGPGYNSGIGNQRGLLQGYLAALAITKRARKAV